jgi:hypothetical protein
MLKLRDFPQTKQFVRGIKIAQSLRSTIILNLKCLFNKIIFEGNITLNAENKASPLIQRINPVI